MQLPDVLVIQHLRLLLRQGRVPKLSPLSITILNPNHTTKAQSPQPSVFFSKGSAAYLTSSPHQRLPIQPRDERAQEVRVHLHLCDLHRDVFEEEGKGEGGVFALFGVAGEHVVC